MRSIAESLGWKGPPDFNSWQFKDEPSKVTPEIKFIAIEFGPWDRSDTTVHWNYDEWRNSYLRSQGGLPITDEVSGKRLTAKNIIVQFAQLQPSGDGVHILWDTIGEGDALIFQDGQVIESDWSKPTADSRTTYLKKDGTEIKFNRGTTWVEIVNIGSLVSFSDSQ